MLPSYLFLRSKVEKQIKFSGESFTFTHNSEDEYHRPTETIETTLKGIYHQATSYEQKTSSNATITNKKPKPMILCLYDEEKPIYVGDTTIINGKDMMVTGIENVQELNAVIQISLEVNE